MKLFDNLSLGDSNFQESRSNDIAIIGMSVRLPQAENVSAFWNALVRGEDCIGEMTKQRREDTIRIFNSFDSSAEYVYDEGAYLESISEFDHNFFNIPIAQARLMNPTHRLFLETMWHSMEDAGITSKAINASATGVYIAYSWNMNNYYWIANRTNPKLAKISLTDNIASTLAGRISYLFNLKGPSMVIDTACSSSLTALITACNDISMGTIDAAIVGGINITWGFRQASLHNLGIESSSHRSMAFDQSADGIGKGEGVISVILKPLTSAIQCRDKIWAVIKGGAINNDGRSAGLSAPNVDAQMNVITEAWRKSEIDPRQISFIESHGTGTKLGDPIEIEAISKAFKSFTSDTQFCGIGSVKSNIGHLDAAAGLAGIVKAALSLHHGQVPAHLHFDFPNENIRFVDSPVYVTRSITTISQTPRYCGVSSFGVSGTNCHVVMQDHPHQENAESSTKEKLPFALTLSAKSVDALSNLVESFVQFCLKTNASLEEICFSSNVRHDHFTYRLAIVASSKEEMLHVLQGMARESEIVSVYMTENTTVGLPHIARLQDHNPQIGNGRVGLLREVSQSFVNGNEVEWGTFYERIPFTVSLPLYPFEKISCWPKIPTFEVQKKTAMKIEKFKVPVQSMAAIRDRLIQLVAEVLVDDEGKFNQEETFFAMGFDSVTVVHVRQLVAKEFAVDIPVESLFDEINTIDLLAEWLNNRLSGEDYPKRRIANNTEKDVESPEPADKPYEDISVKENLDQQGLSKLFDRQLDIMKEQIELVKASGWGNHQNGKTSHVDGKIPLKSHYPTPTIPTPPKLLDSTGSFSLEQTRYLSNFIDVYQTKTLRSKEHTQRHRKQFASYRKALHYDHFFKEITYPIFAETSSGSKVVDIDGNTYIDFAMGFGVHLLGYGHPEVSTAIQNQIKQGVFIGPMSPKAGVVASLICDITGAERAAFSNSGTESIMHCIRMARAATGRDKIVIFSNSYHGFFDGVLAVADPVDRSINYPVSIGVPKSLIRDVVVLPYGEDESLETIRAMADELAAVIVEPVQSRRLDFLPEKFLKELRQVTTKHDVALIFDEVITGFRLHPRGAAGFYGIDPDITAFGKVLGSGMPIGAMSGKSKYLDLLDGGMWQFGDSSAPKMQRVATGGTFCHQPVALAAAEATLSFLQREGARFYDGLAEKTSRLTNELNEFFTSAAIPIKVVQCGSMFSFKPLQQVRSLHILYFHLINRGIYLWQGAICFMSAAHTEEDMAVFVKAVKDSCRELILMDLLRGELNEAVELTVSRAVTGSTNPELLISPIQKRLLFLSLLHKSANVYCLPAFFVAKQSVDAHALKESWRKLVMHYEALRSSFFFAGDSPRVKVTDYSEITFGLEVLSFTKSKLTEQQSKKHSEDMLSINFSVEEGPLLKARLIEFKDHSLILFNFHHLIVDGLSIEIILRKLFDLYSSIVSGSPKELDPLPFQYKDYALSLNEYLSSHKGERLLPYWKTKLARIEERKILPYDFERGTAINSKGDYVVVRLTHEEIQMITSLSRETDTTFFIILLSAIKILIYKFCGEGVISVGCPLSGRISDDLHEQIGCFVNSVVLLDELEDNDTIEDVLSKVKKTVVEASIHQLYPFDRMVNELSPTRASNRNSLFEIDVNMNEQRLGKASKGSTHSILEPIEVATGTTKFDLTFSLFPPPSALVSIEFKTSLFKRKSIEVMGVRLKFILHEICKSPDEKLSRIKWSEKEDVPKDEFKLQNENF